MPKIAKITGGAGTQKTSHLIRQIEKDLDTRFMRDIGAVSLTKAAVKTIQQRLFHKGIKGDDAKTVGTIHSLSYSIIGKQDISDTPGNMKKFTAENPEYSIELNPENDSKSYFEKMQYNRNRLIPLNKWDKETTKFFYTWQAWNNAKNMTDFTGILEKALQLPVNPDFKILYVDETQDQTPLATALIMKWAESCEKVAFYGDDDQSLYRFSGAVPESFIDLPADYSSNRPQSFRCPPNILNHAMKIIRKCNKRIDKDYAPITPELLEKQNLWRSQKGQPAYDYTEGIIQKDMDIPDLTLPGQHMILTRANYQLEQWRHWLLENHLLFCNPYRAEDKALNPTETKIWKALQTYQRITAGNEVISGDLQEMAECAKAAEIFQKRGLKAKLMNLPFSQKIETFGLLDFGFKEEFIFGNIDINNVFRFEGQSGDLAKWHYKHGIMPQPQVILGTVHSVKGGEAENIWLDMGSTPAIHKAVIMGDKIAEDDERRVAYVAITRARRSFGLLNNKMKNLVL